jgi:hypothetical protein
MVRSTVSVWGDVKALCLLVLLAGCRGPATFEPHATPFAWGGSLRCDHVVVTVDGIRLTGWLRFQSPRRLRLVLFSAFGKELEMGSNDRQFWFWCKRTKRVALYYAEHGQKTRLKAPFNPLFVLRSLQANVSMRDESGKVLCCSTHRGNVIDFQWFEENQSLTMELKGIRPLSGEGDWALPDITPRVDMAKM